MSNPEKFDQNKNEFPQETLLPDQVESFLANVAADEQLYKNIGSERDDPFGQEVDRLAAGVEPQIIDAFETQGFRLDIPIGKTLEQAFEDMLYEFDANQQNYENFAARYTAASEVDRIALDTEADERYTTYRMTHAALVEKHTLLYYANKASYVLIGKKQFANDSVSYKRFVNDEAAALVAAIRGDAVFDEAGKEKIMNTCKSLLGAELITAAINQMESDNLIQKNLAEDLAWLDTAIEKQEFKNGLQQFLQASGAAPAIHEDWKPLLDGVTDARWARITTYSDDQALFMHLYKGIISNIRLNAMRLGIRPKEFNILLNRLLQIDDTL